MRTPTIVVCVALSVAPANALGQELPLARPLIEGFASARAIGLQDLGGRVAQGNLAVARARLQVATSEHQREVAWSSFLPTLSLSAGYAKVDGWVQGSFGDLRDVEYGSVRPYGRLELQLNPIAAAFGVSVAKQEALVATLGMAEVSGLELLGAAEGYLDLVRAQAAYAVRGDALAAAEGLASIAAATVRGGTGSATDVLRTRTQVARQQEALLSAELDLRSASHALAERLHLPVGEPLLAAQTALRAEAWAPPQLESGELLRRAEVHRPELRARREARQVAETQRHRAVASLAAPSVGAYAQLAEVGTGYQSLAGAQSSYGIGVTWDLSPGRYVQTRLAADREDEARLAFETSQDRVAREVLDAAAALRVARARLVPARSAVDNATEAVKLGEVRFRAGNGTATDVIEAQKDLDSARFLLVNAVVSLNRAQLRLLAAMGELDARTLGAH